MNIEENVVTSENTPRPFLEIPKLWLQLNKMSEDFFRQEISHTSAKNTLLSVLVYAGIATAISVLLSILRSAISYFTQPSSLLTPNILVVPILLACVGIVIIPGSFYLNIGVTFVSALIFGGKGKFVSQAYLESLFIVPLGLISSVFSFASLIPTIGDYVLYILVFGIVIFNLIFVVRTFKVVHRFTTTRAIVAILAPVLLLLLPICIIGMLMLMGPVIGNVFSTINASLATPVP